MFRNIIIAVLILVASLIPSGVQAQFVIDSGVSLPTNPITGQTFLHTPIGRSILYVYDGSAWQPQRSFGAMTVYVGTSGTDNLSYGTSAVNAFRTIQYAWNSIPPLYGGDVIINVAAGTYNENLIFSGKTSTGGRSTGDYIIKVQGTLSLLATGVMDSAVQGVGSTQGSITKANGFGNYDNKLLFANNEYRIIDSDTTNVASVVGCWSNIPTGTYSVYDWGTVINGTHALNIPNGQGNVYCYGMGFEGSGLNNVHTSQSSFAWFLYCKFGGSGSVLGEVHAINTFSTCLFNVGSGAYCYPMSTTHSHFEQIMCKTISGASGIGLRLLVGGEAFIDGGTVFDGMSIANSTAILVEQNGVLFVDPTIAGFGYPRIRNWGIGIKTVTGGVIDGADNIQYSGNTLNTSDSSALMSKISTYASRNLADATSDVTFTLGFKPSMLICLASLDGASSWSVGFSDSNKTAYCLINMGGLNYAQGATMLGYVGTQIATNFQVITVKSYNSDGVTLTWTKIGNPSGIAYYNIIGIK